MIVHTWWKAKQYRAPTAAVTLFALLLAVVNTACDIVEDLETPSIEESTAKPALAPVVTTLAPVVTTVPATIAEEPTVTVLMVPKDPTVTDVAPVPVVNISVSRLVDDELSVGNEVKAGAVVTIEARFEPVYYHVDTLSISPWNFHSVTAMRTCFALDNPCSPSGDWMPFAPIQTFDVVVARIGPQVIWLTAEFQDAAGDSIPALAYSGSTEPDIRLQLDYQIVGYPDESTPAAMQPPAIQTTVVSTGSDFLVDGSVAIAGNRCCTGGIAGTTISLNVAFSASSPFGEVTEMRVSTFGRNCSLEVPIDDQPWEPFVSHKRFPFNVPINWVTFYVRVQYRDAQGNLSPVFCDDIGVEGNPPPPSPTP